MQTCVTTLRNRRRSPQAVDLRRQVYPPDTQARYVNAARLKGRLGSVEDAKPAKL